MNNQAAQTMPSKFRKKPVVIEALQYTGENWLEVMTFVGDRVKADGDGLIIPTLEGQHIASPGDWIIRGVKGEHYPCKPDIFAATYEAAALSQTAGVVEGWKLVPVEPTEAMCEAAMSSLGWSRSQAAATAAPITPASPMMEGAMKVWSGMLAAAPSASGVDTRTNEAWVELAQEKIAAMDASASVSDRARDERFTAMLIGIIADVQDALGFTDEDKECSNGSLEIVAAIRELQEQALTQQRGEREDAHKFRRLAQLLDGFDFRLGRNALMPPATYLDYVEITCEFQPGVGQSVIDAIVDVLATEKLND